MTLNLATASFIQEARDLLEGLETTLLELEQRPDQEKIDAVFRALHTVKGSSGMFGFGILASFTHHFEDAFDRVRDGKLVADSALVNLSLAARDHMLALLEAGGDGPRAEAIAASETAHHLIAKLAALLQMPPAPSAETAAIPPKRRSFDIWFKPHGDALRNGMRPDLLLQELAELGEISWQIDTEDLPALETMEADRSYIGYQISLQTGLGRKEIDAVFIFADDADLKITETTVAVESAPAAGKMPAMPVPSPGDMAARPPESQLESVRVPSSRLDEMMDQLGELVIAYSRLEQIAHALKDPVLENMVEEVERLVTGLRDTTLSIRMLPIEIVFGKFRRVVRDLSQSLGKDVDLVTEGGDTEIDKTVIDRLTEPLVHMIRNSVDHGIETADQRLAAGKSARATVRLTASQQGGEVLIAIEDDGAGVNVEAVRRRAIERGLVGPEEVLSEADWLDLLFEPGFSTATAVSAVSGRGVGMDAVRSTIEALRGSVTLSTVRGQGTRVLLRLPLTLAIIEGLLVRLGDATYVIPLSAVEECVEYDQADLRGDSGRSMLQIRDDLVPFVDLGTVFQRPKSAERNRRVVIVKSEATRIGIIVDDILGQNQTVIKTLSPFHRSVQALAGATILGDGTVALIIDVVGLSKRARLGERRQVFRRSTDHLTSAWVA